MIKITDKIFIDPRDIEETFIRGSGPGGQNVNKVSTAVQLRYDIRCSSSLPDNVRARAERLAGRRLTKEGVVVITATRYRTQEKNRDDALSRLTNLLKGSALPLPDRRPTRPTLGSIKRRLDKKAQRGTIKKLRSGMLRDD